MAKRWKDKAAKKLKQDRCKHCGKMVHKIRMVPQNGTMIPITRCINGNCPVNKEVDPTQGGCWFCKRKHSKMVRSYEFDCSLHQKCLERSMNMNPANPETRIIYEEIIGEISDELDKKAIRMQQQIEAAKAQQKLKEEDIRKIQHLPGKKMM